MCDAAVYAQDATGSSPAVAVDAPSRYTAAEIDAVRKNFESNYLLGDWGGARTALWELGIDPQVLQSATFWNGWHARVVGAGNDTQAMVTLDGTFLCKGGWNPYSASPCEDDILGNFGDITQIAVGLTHLLVLRSDGTMYAWATLTDDPNLNTPSNTGPITQIAAGSSHSVALSSAGRVYCWGRNSEGQCNIPADIGKVKRIAAGTDHTIAIRDFGTPFTDGDAATDDCPYGRGDLNADGFVDAEDLSTLMSLWGYIDAEIGDLDADRVVDGDDLAQLLSNWNARDAR